MKWFNKLRGKTRAEMIIIYNRTAEQEAMFQEQLRIRALLGFEEGNDTQNWLRIHQIMLDHENRIKALETEK
jgi:hypothetical protein